MFRLRSVITVTALVGLAACSSSSGESGVEETEVATTVITSNSGTASVASSTTTTTIAPPTSAAPAVAIELSAASVVAALPLIELVDEGSGPRGYISVQGIDWLALSEVSGQPRPTPGDVAAAGDAADDLVYEWLRAAVFQYERNIEIGPGGFPYREALGESSLVSDAFGFGFADVDTSIGMRVSLASRQLVQFDVVSGDVELSADLIDLGTGVMSLGEGDDFERNVDQRSVLQPFGAPIRAAQVDEMVALSENGQWVAEWVAADSVRLDTDPRYAALVASLDAYDPLQVWSYETDFTLDRERQTDSNPGSLDDVRTVSQPFDLVGGVTTLIDGEVGFVVSYVFGDPDTALAMVPELDDLWSRSDVGYFDPLEEMVDVQSISASGLTTTIAMTVRPGSTRRPSPDEWAFSSEPIFLYDVASAEDVAAGQAIITNIIAGLQAQGAEIDPADVRPSDGELACVAQNESSGEIVDVLFECLGADSFAPLITASASIADGG